MTNSERRISRVRPAVRPPAEARADWSIAVDFARRLFPEKKHLMGYEDAESIFDEHRETTRGRDLDITGLSYALLDELGPQQWPFPEGAREGRKRLYEDGIFPTASGQARFVPTPYRPVAEDVDERYPLRLTTGRLRDQWHTMSRTGTIASLFAHEPEPRATIHPEDLARFGCKDADLVRIRSRRGEVLVRAAADADMARGVMFLPMHWGGRFLGGAGRLGVNEITIGALDPVSRQPELKHCAVSLEKADLPWRLEAQGEAADASALFAKLDPLMQAAPYAARTLVGRERAGVRLALAAEQPLPEDLLRRISALLPLASPGGKGRTICNCFDVAEADIDAFLKGSSSMRELQARLKCGTRCGSCLPEIRRRVAA